MILLEAEVLNNRKHDFEKKYQELTGNKPSGECYKIIEDNKWGMELRIYFNDDLMANDIKAKKGIHPEERHSGYLSDRYKYRVNSNELWWTLVKKGFRLGLNPIKWDPAYLD